MRSASSYVTVGLLLCLGCGGRQGGKKESDNVADGIVLTKTRVLQAHTDGVVTLTLTAKNVLVSGGFDNKIFLWDLDKGISIGSMEGHQAYVSCLRVWDEKNILIASDGDGKIFLWDLATQKPLFSFRAHNHVARSFAISSDKTRLASVGFDRKAKTWDLEQILKGNAAQLASIDLPCDMKGIDISDDGKLFVLSGDDNNVLIHEVDTGRLVRSVILQGDHAAHCSAIWQADGVLCGVTDGTLRVVDKEGKEKHVWHTQAAPIFSMSHVDELIISAGNKQVSIFDWKQQKVVARVRVESLTDCHVFCKDKMRLVTGDFNGMLHFWSVER